MEIRLLRLSNSNKTSFDNPSFPKKNFQFILEMVFKTVQKFDSNEFFHFFCFTGYSL